MQLQMMKELLMQLQEQIMLMQQQEMTMQIHVNQLQPQPQTSMEMNIRQMFMRIYQMYNHLQVELLQMNKLMMSTKKMLVPQTQMDEMQQLQEMMQLMQQQQQHLHTELELQPQLQLTEEMQEIANLVISNEALLVHLQRLEMQFEQLQRHMIRTQMKLLQIHTLSEKQMQHQLYLIEIIMRQKQLPSQLLHLFQNLLLPLSDETQITLEMYLIRGQLLLMHDKLSQMQLQLEHPLFMENMHVHLAHVQFMFIHLQDHHEQLLEQIETDKD